MDNRIANLRGHVIVCGYGRVGRAATEQLLATGRQVVVIDVDQNRFDDADLLNIVGDATDDEVLRHAGVEHAKALIGALDSDAETVYLTLSARALRRDLIIVSRARTAESKEKLVLAGATRAVNPQMIGGRRLAAFALQRHVAEFVDTVLHDETTDYRFHQWVVPPGSPVAGQPLAELDLTARTGLQVLAVRSTAQAPFEVGPSPEWTPQAGSVLILMGGSEDLELLAKLR